MNNYTEAQTKEINDKYDAIQEKALSELVVEVNSHNDKYSNVTVGYANIGVMHKITMDREPRTEWMYSNGDDQEVTTGIDYTANVEVEFTSVIFDSLIVSGIDLPEGILNRVILAIAEQAENEAEQADDIAAVDAYEASFD
jgi:hypothetical protein